MFCHLIKNITPLKLGSNSFPYNLGNLSKDFKYGDAIILVEGVADLAGLKLLDPTLNIVAMQSCVFAYLSPTN